MGKKFLLLVISIICPILQFVGEYITLETVFPGLVFYHLLTFSLSYPKSRKIRKFIISFSLCFMDLGITALIFKESITSLKIGTWVLQFIIIYIIVTTARVKELYAELAGTNFRCAVFLMASYVKSTSLVSFMSYYYSINALNHSWQILIILYSISKVMSTPFVYLLDNFYWTKHANEVSLREFFSRFEKGFGAILLILGAILIFNPNPDELTKMKYDPLFMTDNYTPKLIANALFFVWYGFEAIDYGHYFKKVQ